MRFFCSVLFCSLRAEAELEIIGKEKVVCLTQLFCIQNSLHMYEQFAHVLTHFLATSSCSDSPMFCENFVL